MKKILLLMVGWMVGCAVCAAPVRSMLSGRECAGVEAEDYWGWPTEWAEDCEVVHRPGDVWIPAVGKWYGRIAFNGYNGMGSGRRGDFTEDSVISKTSSGYSMGVFVSLPAGEYLACLESSKQWQPSVSVYVPVEDGYKYSEYTLFSKRAAGYTDFMFRVEDGNLYLLKFVPTVQNEEATFTNIRIYRLGE